MYAGVFVNGRNINARRRPRHGAQRRRRAHASCRRSRAAEQAELQTHDPDGAGARRSARPVVVGTTGRMDDRGHRHGSAARGSPTPCTAGRACAASGPTPCRGRTSPRWSSWPCARPTPATRRCGASSPWRTPGCAGRCGPPWTRPSTTWPRGRRPRAASKEIKALRAYATFFADAPLVMAVFGLPYGSRADEMLARAGLARRSATGSARARTCRASAAAVQLLCTAAHAMGYGSCWMTAPVLAAPAIEELLGVEAPAKLVAVVPIGRPASPSAAVPAPPGRGRPRVPLSVAGRACRCRPGPRYTRRTRRPRAARYSSAATVNGRNVLWTTRRVDRRLCARALDGAARTSATSRRCSRRRRRGAAVFAAAREPRARHFGDTVFLYGFIYFSTYCRNECAFCFYRADNDESPRYRKSSDEVVAICRDLAGSGVVLLDLTMGEDPAIHDEPGYAGAARAGGGRRATDAGLPVMVSPGVVPDDVLRRPARRRRRLVRAVPGDAHAGAVRRACAWGSRSRRASPRAARPGAPACSSRTASSRASATRPPTAPAPSRPCATPAGSRCGS